MTTTFFQDAAQLLRALTEKLPNAVAFENAQTVLAQLMTPWGALSVPSRARFHSHIGDDHTPYEFSVAFAPNKAVEVRILVEAQAAEPTLAATQAAGLALNERLAKTFGLPLARFEKVRELFLPANPQGALSLWHAVCLWRDTPPEFKLYMNPQIHGRENAPAVIKEAMHSLGLGGSVEGLFQLGAKRGFEQDELCYFSLDLNARPAARVKVYFRHYDVTAADLERTLAYSPSHQAGDVTYFAKAIARSVGPFRAKPVGTCFSFIEGNAEPYAATVHLPIAHYANDDAEARDRIAAFLVQQGASGNDYKALLEAFGRRPLDAGPGIQSYCSYRRENGALRTTIYLSPELFQQARIKPWESTRVNVNSSVATMA